jgi:hypothetical protein
MGKAQMRLIDEVIKEHGYALTRVTKGNEIGAAFVERLGFKAHSDDGTVVTYVRAKNGN